MRRGGAVRPGGAAFPNRSRGGGGVGGNVVRGGGGMQGGVAEGRGVGVVLCGETGDRNTLDVLVQSRHVL